MPAYPPAGWIAVVQPAGEPAGDVVQLLVQARADVSQTRAAYDVVVCGPHPYTGDLLIGGPARFSKIVRNPVLPPSIPSPKIQNVRDLVFGFGRVINLGSVQLVRISLPTVSACPPSSDLPAGALCVSVHLASDDDSVREAGADAARVLLTLDATRIIAFGQPLAASVRGPDRGYAGYPHPAAAALRALAEAWRSEPELTCQILETRAAGASQEARNELARLPWFVQRFGEPWDASEPATSEAVKFVVRRAGGDWGDEAAFHAADHLTSFVREIPEPVAAHAEEMLGAILPLCTRNGTRHPLHPKQARPRR